MRLEEVKISPQQAREWLSVDQDRAVRSVRPRRVSELQHAIDNGEWRVTHQAIAIDPSGFVLDGRHRLTAIAGQRKHVKCLVAFDADPDSFQVIDTGTRRTPGDTLKIAGYTDTIVLAATARLVALYPHIMGTTSTMNVSQNQTMTSAEILHFVDQPDVGKILQDAVRPGHRIANGVGRYGFRTPATALVALLALYSKHGVDTQREFVDRLADGTNLDATSPILGLRRWVLSDTGMYRVSGSYRTTAAMVAGINTWNRYANGQERTQIRYRPGQDTIPEID